VVLTPGIGGGVFHTRIRTTREDVRSLRLKLFMEAWYSVETAMELEPHIPEGSPIVVHLDVNPDKRWASSRHISEVVGLVMGQGISYSGGHLAIVDLNLEEAETQAKALIDTFKKENPEAENLPRVTAHYADVSDPESDDRRVGVGLLEGGDATPDLWEEVAGLQFLIVVVDV